MIHVRWIRIEKPHEKAQRKTLNHIWRQVAHERRRISHGGNRLPQTLGFPRRRCGDISE